MEGVNFVKIYKENPMWKLLLSDVSLIIQFHLDIEINVTDNRHFAFVYLLGSLDYSLYGQRHKSVSNKNSSIITFKVNINSFHLTREAIF